MDAGGRATQDAKAEGPGVRVGVITIYREGKDATQAQTASRLA